MVVEVLLVVEVELLVVVLEVDVDLVIEVLVLVVVLDVEVLLVVLEDVEVD